MQGFFSVEALEQCGALLASTYDYTRCVRPDGSTYGTRGKCRKGTETSSGEKVATAQPKSVVEKVGAVMVKAKEEERRLKKAKQKAINSGDKEAAAKARRDYNNAKRRLQKAVVLWNEIRAGGINHSETMDFTRCLRPDGSAYGTGGKCRKGTQSAKESSGKTVTSGSKGKSSLDKQIQDAYERERAAREAGDTEAARKAMREHMALVKQKESKTSGKSKEDKAREIMTAIKQEKDPEKQRDLIRKLEDVNNPLVKLPGGRVARTIDIKSPYEF